MHLLIRAFVECRQYAEARRPVAAGRAGRRRDPRSASRKRPTPLAEGRIVLIDRPLSSIEVGLALEAINLVVTPYPTHVHSASIVIPAAARRRAGIGFSHRLDGTDDSRISVGLDMQRSRSRLSPRGATCAPLEASDGFRLPAAAERFIAFHGAANFAAHWNRRLRERLGAAPDENLIPWEFVLEGEAAP